VNKRSADPVADACVADGFSVSARAAAREKCARRARDLLGGAS
jgi:hypothetical protein